MIRLLIKKSLFSLLYPFGYLATLLSILLLLGCQSSPAYHQTASGKIKKAPNKYGYNPAAAPYNVQLAVAYLREGEVDRAKQKLIIAEKQDPKSALVLDAKAYFLEMTGELEQARYYYLKAIQLNPGMGMPLNNYGTFLCRQQRYLDAEKQFLLAIKDNQYLSLGEAYENAGMCAMQQGDASKAERYLGKALQKQPKLSNALLALAQLNYDKSDYNQASIYLQRFNGLGRVEPESLKLAILLADQAKDADSVLTNLAALAKQFPNSPTYEAMRKKYGRYRQH